MNCSGDGADDGDDEQDQVGEHDAQKAARCGKHHGGETQDEENLEGAGADHHGGDLDRRQRDRGERDDVEDDPDIDGPERPQSARHASGITQGVKLKIGQNARSPPEPCIDEGGDHSRGQHRPPEPVF